MSWFARLKSRFSELLNRPRAERELDEEIAYHLGRETDRLIGAGADPAEAKRIAQKAFGRASTVREQAREEWRLRWVEDTLRDLKYAARGLRRSPTFTVAAVLTLGLAIGATTAIYSIVDAVLLDDLPYPEPDRLVRMFEQNAPTNRWSLSVVDFQAVKEQQRSFEHVAALQAARVTLTGRGRPERFVAGRVTADWFRVLGVHPLEGRGFATDEDQPGSSPVVVISAGLRDRMFGEGARGIDEVLTLDGVPHTVVGVLGRDRASLAGLRADVWPILQLEPPTRRGPFFLRGFGRLSGGVSVAGAEADLADITRRIYPIWAEGFRDEKALITPYSLRETILGGVGTGVWLLFGAVLGVLLIATANVANLLMVRASGREHEMALRTSLGGTKRRLVRLLLTESLLLAAIGGAVGVALAFLCLETFVGTSPNLPRLDEISLDGGVLAFAAAVTLGSGVLFGLAPLLQTAPSLMQNLRGGDRADASGSRGRRLRSALVAAEFAIALPLLAGAALLVSSFVRLQNVDPGYDPTNLVSADVSLPPAEYEGYSEVVAFWDEALRRVREIPGVRAAGIGTGLPPNLQGETNNFDLVDKPVPEGSSEPSVPWSWASPGFWGALGVPLQRGRMFEERDGRDSLPVVMVSEAWASRYYPDGDVLGKQLYSGGDRDNPMTVVGVLANVKFEGLDTAGDVAVHEPFAQAGFRSVSLLVRSEGPVAGIVGRLRAVFQELDPALPLSNVETMDARLSAEVAGPRYWTTLFSLFAGLGLVLAAIGVYGVLSYTVSRQSREIAIRIALGAHPAAVRRSVVLGGMARVGIGIAIGLTLALLGTQWLESLLFDVSATDPLALAVAVAGLVLIAGIACYVPAHRATKIDPMRALRAD